MPTVHFTAHLNGVAPPEPMRVSGACVLEALNQVFAVHPRLEGYILDDQGCLRKHVAIFVDGELLRGDSILDLHVAETTEVHVLQALSGG